MGLTFKLILIWDEIEKFYAMVGFMHLMQSRLVSRASSYTKEDGYESGSAWLAPGFLLCCHLDPG